MKTIQTVTAAAAPRSLPEIENLLKKFEDKIQDLDALTKTYQSQISKQTASEFEYVIKHDQVVKPTGKKILLDRTATVKIPNPEALKKNFAIVDELSEQVEGLEQLYNTTAIQFRSIRGTGDVLKSIKALKKVAEDKLSKALDFLQNLGTKHIPEHFQNFVNTVAGSITPDLQFKDSNFYVYAYLTPEGELAFSVYLELKVLALEDGSMYPKFFIVLTNKMVQKGTKIESEYFVNTMLDFASPGKFNPGKSVTNPAEAVRALGLKLELENVATSIGVLPHNLPKDLKVTKFTMKDFVSSINVDPDTIEFSLVPGITSTKANEIAQSLYVEVRSLISGVRKAKLKVKIYQTAKKVQRKTIDVYTIRFSLTNLAREDQISVNDIEFLKETFNLDDDKLSRVIKAING